MLTGVPQLARGDACWLPVVRFNVVFQGREDGPHRDIVFRRNIVANAHSGGHSSGLYATHTDGLGSATTTLVP